MPESDCLQILLRHDRWAWAQLIQACEALSHEQLHKKYEIGRGSLHDTLTHVAAAMRTWNDTLSSRDLRPRLETDGQQRTAIELAILINGAADELATEARRLPLSDSCTRKMRDGREFTFTRAEILVHVTTHGMHHRAQCLNMLRHLGVLPLPPSSVAEWTWITGAP